MKAADEPVPDSPRTLADILREAGIEPAGRGGRRRRGERPPEAVAEPGVAAEPESEPEPEPEPESEPEPEPEPELEPLAAPDLDADAEPAIEQESTPQPEQSRRPVVEMAPEPESAPEPAAARGHRGGTADPPTRSRGGGLLGWLVFAVELVVAAVLGVLIWYAFSVLWELYPYVAAVAAPIVLAGLVSAGQLLRRWRAREPLGTAAIAALLFVAAFLVVLPAAAVLSRS